MGFRYSKNLCKTCEKSGKCAEQKLYGKVESCGAYSRKNTMTPEERERFNKIMESKRLKKD